MDDKTHRFMDRNKPKGLRKNSRKMKMIRRWAKHPSTINKHRRRHGRTTRTHIPYDS